VRFHRRPGDLPIEAPSACGPASDELPVDLVSFEVDPHNFTTRVGNRGLVRARVGRLGVRGDGVNHRAMAVIVSCMCVASIWLVAVMRVLVLGMVMMRFA
jgi:hypothetical protein